MPKLSPLEAQLTAIAHEFVARIVTAIRGASFADVARFAPTPAQTSFPATSKRKSARRGARHSGNGEAAASPRGRRPRQSPEKRAELAGRLLDALRQHGAPMGVRALSSALGVPADLLMTPLRELRSSGKIAKHGEKRNTTYAAAS